MRHVLVLGYGLSVGVYTDLFYVEIGYVLLCPHYPTVSAKALCFWTVHPLCSSVGFLVR